MESKYICKSWVVLIDGDTIIMQAAEYIEHGGVIKIVGSEISLYEIPYGGGDEIFIGKYNTLAEAINAANNLT